ncbi:hypothetical protein BLA29_009261 [Euroglyphus maynei]|uniref:Uncharacterized protein n=1 Tax=Euroglyphus maynei TaxID=6958 RepID=A0A1Y3B8I6_EURMA|nr:hypothetical protein BLA29_009261 [Euroglyphus maynei]
MIDPGCQSHRYDFCDVIDPKLTLLSYRESKNRKRKTQLPFKIGVALSPSTVAAVLTRSIN